MSDRKIVFYDCDPDAEHLYHETIADAVVAEVYRFPPMDMPETVAVYGWARMVPAIDDGGLLEYILEHLDEEYGDPEAAVATAPTETMEAAAREFAAVIEREYEGWACERVSVETVRVADYVWREG